MFTLNQRVWLDGDLSTVVGVGTTYMRGHEIPRVLVRCTTPDGTGRSLFALEGNDLYALEPVAFWTVRYTLQGDEHHLHAMSLDDARQAAAELVADGWAGVTLVKLS